MLKAISTLISQISSLANATVPLAGTETVPIDQSGAKKVTVANLTKGRTIQTTGINDNNNNEVITITTTASAVNELTVANSATGANPVISATGSDTNIGITLTPKGTGNAVLTSGNLVVANGNGIDFSATAGTGTSELLNDYEEGNWTPIVRVGSGTGTQVTTTTTTAKYTKIGRLVRLEGYIVRNDATAHTGTMYMTGMPFTGYTNEAQIGGGAWFDNATSTDIRSFSYTNGTEILFPLTGTTNNFVNVEDWDNNRYIYFSINYMT